MHSPFLPEFKDAQQLTGLHTGESH